METAIIATSLVFLLLAFFIIAFVVFHKRKQQKNKNEKQLMQTQFQQELLQTQIEIQEQTLKNISEEIHDNIGQVLSLAKLNLNTFPKDAGDAVKQRLADTELLVSKAIDDLRDLSQSMHGDKIASIGLETALARELKLIQNTGKFITALHIKGDTCTLDAQKEMVLFRIVQESLNNAVKHSHAKNIDITLEYNPPAIILQIKDDGNGFDNTKQKPEATGLGLSSMKNRAALIGASFTLYSLPEKGTTVTIELKNNQ